MGRGYPLSELFFLSLLSEIFILDNDKNIYEAQNTHLWVRKNSLLLFSGNIWYSE